MLLDTLQKKQKMHGDHASLGSIFHMLIWVYSIIAGKGMLTSAFATCLLGFGATILFLFCTPDLDTLFSLQAPQPFVLIYAQAVGKAGSVVLTIIAVLTLIVVEFLCIWTDDKLYSLCSQDASVCIVSASRLIFAVARDGVLPMSNWIAQVNSAGQPRNAITIVYLLVATILCTMLPSQVAFFSLVSASTVLLIASYGLISLLRLTMTPNNFKSSYFYLGRFRKLLYSSSVLWNAFLVAVSI
jgi:translation initiation factor 5B